MLPLLGSIELDKINQHFLYLVGGGALFAVGNACGFKVLSHLDAGFGSILGTLGTIFTIIFAGIFLNEELSLQQAAGSIILLGAICYGLLVARQHHKGKKNHRAWLWGFIFAVISGFFIGLALVNEKYLLGHMNTSTVLFYVIGAQMVSSLLLGAILEPKGYKLVRDKAVMKLNIFAGSLRSVAAVLFVLALVKSNNVAVIGVIENFRLVIIIMLAAILLKERDKLGQKFVAACGAIAGLAIIFW